MQLQYKVYTISGAAGGCGLSFTCCQRFIKGFGGASAPSPREDPRNRNRFSIMYSYDTFTKKIA